ncbi:MAG: phytoene desaturase [Bacteroidetes bacterium]|nr:phytoene desaturase [Bacteroidota bacterium]
MSESGNKKALVIGAGLSGLAVAARLSSLGIQVDVFEKSADFGGKAGILNQGGFIFDTGPSLFTLPDYVDEVFRYCGKNPRDYFSYTRLSTLTHYFWEDGYHLQAPSDIQLFAKRVEASGADSADAVKKFLSHSKRIHELTEKVFIRKSLHKVTNYLGRETLNGLLHFQELDTGISMEKAIRKYFKDPHIIQLFMRYATYNGSNPYKAPGTLNVIPHLEFGLGAYMPEKGIRAIPEALYALCRDLGVIFHFNSEVERIETRKSNVSGLRVNGQSISADYVVCNADIHTAYPKLLPDVQMPKANRKQEQSSSAFIFYWGMDAVFDTLDVHNIFFSRNYQQEFNSLFEDLKMDEDPTVYIHISSKVCPEHAPPGKENWFVMVNAPQHRGQDWIKIKEQLRKTILRKVGSVLNKDLAPLIVNESWTSPEDIERKTASFRGSLYGPSSNSRFAAFLRHPNFHKKYKNLYFCGGSVHPGGGIPLVMASAEIVSHLLIQD